MDTTINKRLKELRKILGMSQVDFGNRLHVSHGSITAWENGAPIPKSRIVAISQAFNVNEEWLEHGIGDMFKPKQAPLDAREIQRELIIRIFRELSDDTRKLVLDSLREMVESEKKTK